MFVSFYRSLFVCALLIVLTSPSGVHAQGRLRGMNVPDNISVEDVAVLASWNVNFVRYQFSWHGVVDSATSDEYKSWLAGELDHFDTLLPAFQAAGIRVLFDLHTPPGGFYSEEYPAKFRLFEEEWPRQTLGEVWRLIAERYAGNDTIWAFEIVSEPATGTLRTNLLWPVIAAEVVEIIWAVDPDRLVVVAPDYAKFSRLLPLARRLRRSVGKARYRTNVVHNVHLFEPFTYATQGLSDERVYPYPSGIHNRKRLAATMRKVRRVQRRAGAKQLLVGEFSVVRWAPSAAGYLNDIIRLFESHRWHWAYHIFRESDVWSVEHSADRGDLEFSAEETDRARILKSAFAKNIR